MINRILLDDIKSQPEAFAKTYQDLQAQTLSIPKTKKAWRRVFFSGSGDSYFAALSLQYLLRKNQIRAVHALRSMEAANYWLFSPEDLFVAVSFSGENATTIKSALTARDQGAYVLGITCDENSPLS